MRNNQWTFELPLLLQAATLLLLLLLFLFDSSSNEHAAPAGMKEFVEHPTGKKVHKFVE